MSGVRMGVMTDGGAGGLIVGGSIVTSGVVYISLVRLTLLKCVLTCHSDFGRYCVFSFVTVSKRLSNWT